MFSAANFRKRKNKSPRYPSLELLFKRRYNGVNPGRRTKAIKKITYLLAFEGIFTCILLEQKKL